MRVDNLDSNTTFGKIYCGGTVLNRFGSPNAPKNFANRFKEVRSALEARNIDKFENLDLTINYSQNKGFYATASSKDLCASDMNNYMHKIKTDKASLDTIEEWARYWDWAFGAMKENAHSTVSKILRYISDNYKF